MIVSKKNEKNEYLNWNSVSFSLTFLFIEKFKSNQIFWFKTKRLFSLSHSLFILQPFLADFIIFFILSLFILTHSTLIITLCYFFLNIFSHFIFQFINTPLCYPSKYWISSALFYLIWMYFVHFLFLFKNILNPDSSLFSNFPKHFFERSKLPLDIFYIFCQLEGSSKQLTLYPLILSKISPKSSFLLHFIWILRSKNCNSFIHFKTRIPSPLPLPKNKTKIDQK